MLVLPRGKILWGGGGGGRGGSKAGDWNSIGKKFVPFLYFPASICSVTELRGGDSSNGSRKLQNMGIKSLV